MLSLLSLEGCVESLVMGCVVETVVDCVVVLEASHQVSF